MKYAMLDSAIAFAATAHAGQLRRYAETPYVVHPVELVSILIEGSQTPPDEATLIGAVLHDVDEDTVVSIRTIARRFGEEAAQIVTDMTEVPTVGNRRARKAAECARLSQVQPRSQSVKIADLISNARSIIRYDKGFATVFMAEARALHAALTSADPGLRRILGEMLDEWELGERPGDPASGD
jgi:(p)ppGpp synthase/HD superfamily hydrolase